MPDEEEILYAIFKKDINVTYQKEEANEDVTISKDTDKCTMYNKEENCSITLPNIEASRRYKILGWYQDDNKIGEANQEIQINKEKIYLFFMSLS